MLPIFRLNETISNHLPIILKNCKLSFQFFLPTPCHQKGASLLFFVYFPAQISKFVQIHIINSESIAICLFFVQFLFVVSHRSQQPIIVDEGKNYLAQPSELLSHQVNHKIAWEIIDDWRIGIQHIIMKEFW